MTERSTVYNGVWYRSHPAGRDYRFTFAYVPAASSWRAYITVDPPYGGRPTDAHATHRLHDEHGSYVCWDSPIRTLSDCQGVAALWADCTEGYIRTGRFEPMPGRPAVQDRSSLATVAGEGRRPAAAVPRPPVAARPATTRQAPEPPDNSFQRMLQRLRDNLL